MTTRHSKAAIAAAISLVAASLLMATSPGGASERTTERSAAAVDLAQTRTLAGDFVPLADGAVDDDPGTAAPAASTSATRIRPPVGFFPMNPQPRCDILANYRDPRGGGRRHQGVDILATLGQEVLAIQDGVLTDQVKVGDSNSSLSGNSWELRLPDGTYFFYAHLSGFAPGLEVGSSVKAGDVIAYVGDTGNPGPGNYHLHFEIHPYGGSPIDPLTALEIPPGCKVF